MIDFRRPNQQNYKTKGAKDMAAYFDVGTEATEERVFTVAGIPFPLSPLFTQQSVEKALLLRPYPNDVILCSYPKCDSKNIDIIVWKLLYMDLKHPSINNLTNRFLPCIEMEDINDLSNAYEYISKNKLPKLYKTYLPFRFVPFYKRSKYIYVVRTPWEAAASYYKFLMLQDCASDSFDIFLNDFLNGNVPYGSFFKHIMRWHKRVNENNVLILCHEHVEHNPRSAMFSIAAFLGEHYLTQLMINTELEKNILNSTNWDEGKSVKRYLPKCYLAETDWLSDDYSEFSYSKRDDEKKQGLKPACTKLQLKHITEKFSASFKDSSLEFLWLSLLKKQSPALFN